MGDAPLNARSFVRVPVDYDLRRAARTISPREAAASQDQQASGGDLREPSGAADNQRLTGKMAYSRLRGCISDLRTSPPRELAGRSLPSASFPLRTQEIAN